METSLHRELKERYGPGTGGRTEVSLSGYRVDAIGGDGTLVEVQSGALGPLRGKLATLLGRAGVSVRVVKPVVVARRVVRRARPEGADLSARFSPKRGSLADVFDDLVGLARTFPHPNLTVDVLAVEVDEIRVNRRRRPGYAVVDRRLRAVVETVRLRHAVDLWNLLTPAPNPDEPFTTADLAERFGRRRDFAQRVAYILRHSGAAGVVGKAGNHLVYLRPGVQEDVGPVSDRQGRAVTRSAAAT